jgi:hypothetical protein
MSKKSQKTKTADLGRRDVLKGLATIPVLGIFLFNLFQKWRKDYLKRSNIMSDLIQEKNS